MKKECQSSDKKSYILAVNIDPLDRDTPFNRQKWHEQIARVEGISTTPDPQKLTFTNRGSDATEIV